MVSNQRIIQIIDAAGWTGVYDLGSADVVELRTSPIICWALVEDQVGTRVIGMDADHLAGEQPRGTFLGYAREGEKLDRFRQIAQERRP